MNLKYNKIMGVFIIAAATLSGHAFAGSWVGGGGGDVIGDHANPWFLHNTRVIHTCAIIDTDYFHVEHADTEILKRAISEAESYWREEFRKSYVVGKLTPLATQSFELLDVIESKNHVPVRPCPRGTDLTYQFGYSSSQQRSWLNQSSHGHETAIAVTVRTDYDPIQMKATGFIYLAADSGPFAMRSSSIVSKPWQNGTLRIAEVLKHELGHVYGIQHRGMGMTNVMAMDYPNAMVSLDNATSDGLKEFQTPPFFGIEGNYIFRNYCGGVRWGWRQLLKNPQSDRCTKFIYTEDQVQFFTGPTKEELVLRGTLRLERDDITRFEWEDVIRIFTTENQVAFRVPTENIGAGLPPLFVGPMIKINTRHGRFYTAEGIHTANIEVRFNPVGIGFSKEVFRVQTPTQTYLNLDFEYGEKPSP